MPKTTKKPDAEQKKPGGPTSTSTEALGYVGGLYAEFVDQVVRYNKLTGELLGLQARVDLQEKNLVVTRDHLALAIEKSEEQMPPAWEKQIEFARFVGMRLADACLLLLKERKRVTHNDMLSTLNRGMFRFRTNAPLREIHGALLRQPYVKRTSDGWVWNGPDIIESSSVPQSANDVHQPLRLVGDATAEKK